jgi:uncharacterized protein (TIGR02301 family)
MSGDGRAKSGTRKVSPITCLLAGVLFGCGLLAGFTPASAQGKAKPPAAAAEPVEPPPAPYEAELLRLSEIMGALAYLRDLCGKRDATEWHKQMASLLEAEGTTKARRARLAGAYNRGFRGFENTYRTCTENAELVIQRYLEEGRKIARDAASRFGG